MKSLIVILVALPLISQAQLTKGTLFTGGSVGFNDQNVQGPQNGISTRNTNTFSLIPKLGYMVSDKWAIGLSVGYNSTHTTDEPYTEYDYSGNALLTQYAKFSSNTFSAGVFARRFLEITEKFLFTVEGAVTFARGNYVNSYSYSPGVVGAAVPPPTRESTPSYAVGASLRPLFVFFPSPRWGLEAGLGTLSFNHLHNLNRNPGYAGQNTVTLSGASATSLGIYYYFHRK